MVSWSCTVCNMDTLHHTSRCLFFLSFSVWEPEMAMGDAIQMYTVHIVAQKGQQFPSPFGSYRLYIAVRRYLSATCISLSVDTCRPTGLQVRNYNQHIPLSHPWHTVCYSTMVSFQYTGLLLSLSSIPYNYKTCFVCRKWTLWTQYSLSPLP